MLFTYHYLRNHPATKLNQHLIFFFRKLRNVNSKSTFIPYTEYFHSDFCTHLNGAPVLREKFETFFNVFKTLSVGNKNSVIALFFSAQDIKNIIEDTAISGTQFNLSNLPAKLRTPTKDLFSFMYPSTLNTNENLTKHYFEIYKDVFQNRKLKVCPFCGVEPLLPPHIRRQDYDHILKQESYPFTTVNMKNLVPMGRDCNEIFKERKDSIYNPTTRLRRPFAYPFERSYSIKINLNTSLLPDSKNKLGTWVISFNPNDQYVETWDSIFDIKIRYGDMFLSRYFDDWLLQFEESVKKSKTNITSRKHLKKEFRDKAEIYLGQPLLEFGIIKGALFKLLANCNDNLFYDSLLQKLNS